MPRIGVTESPIAITTVATNSAFKPLGATADICAATLPGSELTYTDTTSANVSAAAITRIEQVT